MQKMLAILGVAALIGFSSQSGAIQNFLFEPPAECEPLPKEFPLPPGDYWAAKTDSRMVACHQDLSFCFACERATEECCRFDYFKEMDRLVNDPEEDQ